MKSRARDTATDILAAYRLTRLVTEDSLTFEAREAIIRWAYQRTDPQEEAYPTWRERAITDGDEAPKLATLVVCPWCASFWVCVGVLAARRVAPRAWGFLADALAGAALAGLISKAEHAAS